LYTQSLSLSAGSHSIQEFVLWNDNQTPGDESDDIPLSAGVQSGSPYAGFVTVTLDLDFDITTEKKIEIPIDVLCIDDQTAADLGFEWNRISEYNRISFAFFGDFCIKNATDYQASAYAQQSNWGPSPFIDVPAIARIELWHKKNTGNWILESTTENSSEGEAIIVSYTDKKDVSDSLMIKISVLVKLGQHFDYKEFFVIKFKEGERPLETCSGGGCTSYYVIGECYEAANYHAPGWNTLPEQVTYKVGPTHAPGTLGGYVDGTISNCPEGYEIANGTYPFYCGDYSSQINIGQEYTMNVYSSLYPEDLPAGLVENSKKWNWLLNHIGLDNSQNYYPGYTWNQLQAALWLIAGWNGTPIDGIAPDAVSQKMATDAIANYSGYHIPVGGWITIIFVSDGICSVQPQLKLIDP